MDAFHIIAEHDRPAQTVSALEQALYAHNLAATGHAAWKAVLFGLRDAGNTLHGGLSGYLWGGWLHVTILWVHESLRGLGFGGALLAAAEAYALEQGCVDVYLSTFEFQAPEFYRKRGYQCFGELADYPRGHAYHFMRKHLGQPV